MQDVPSHVLDKLKVDYYETFHTRFSRLGHITVPEARMIQIAPWEKSLIKEIEKAIMDLISAITPNT